MVLERSPDSIDHNTGNSNPSSSFGLITVDPRLSGRAGSTISDGLVRMCLA